jgi:hypothetical protein
VGLDFHPHTTVEMETFQTIIHYWRFKLKVTERMQSLLSSVDLAATITISFLVADLQDLIMLLFPPAVSHQEV